MKEEWKYIEGYNKKYKISNKGRVMSTYKIVSTWGKRKVVPVNKILKTSNSHGYLKVILTDPDGNKKNVNIHTLVAKYFLHKYADNLEVNHIDGDKTNNNVTNLEWCTRSYNQKHEERVLHPKKIAQCDKEGNVLRLFLNASHASECTGIDRSAIRKVIRGVRKTAGNYMWKEVM